MKKRVLAMMMAVLAVVAFVACEEDTPNTPNEDKKGELAKPELSVVDVTDSSFAVEWEAVENAAGYVAVLKGEVVELSETRVEFDNLATGEYTVRVKAIAAKDSLWRDSQYASVTAIVKGDVTPSEGAERWFGLWSVTSHEAITFDENGDHKFDKLENTFEVSITAGLNPDEVYITDFSLVSANAYARGLVNGNTLYIMNGYVTESADEYDYKWLAYCSVGGTEYMFFNNEIPSYVLTMDDAGNVSCELFADEATFNDGSKKLVQVLHTEVFAENKLSGDISFVGELPVTYRSGVMDWVRK